MTSPHFQAMTGLKTCFLRDVTGGQIALGSYIGNLCVTTDHFVFFFFLKVLITLFARVLTNKNLFVPEIVQHYVGCQV